MPLSLDGFRGLAVELANSIQTTTNPRVMGASLYGEGSFYPARPSYHLFRTCNHWVSNLIRAAGVPSSSIPATFSSTLMAELKARVPEGR